MKQLVRTIIALVTVATGAGVYWKHQEDLQSARDAFQAEAREGTKKTVLDLNDKFSRLYTGLRTIARLPGVRNIDRYGVGWNGAQAHGFEADSRLTVQEIYNNLSDAINMSEIYIVPVDLEPDRIDQRTGKPGEPITTFDEIILGKYQGKGDSKEHEGDEVPEIEIEEYRIMKAQLSLMKSQYPTESKIDGLKFPAYGSKEVVTCDNRFFSPDNPKDSDRSGIVYSVPFYGPDGQLKGCISGVILSRSISSFLPNGNYFLRNAQLGYSIRPDEIGSYHSSKSFAENLKPDPDLIYSEAVPLATADGGWGLWSSQPNAAFWSRTDVKSAKTFALGGWLASLLLGTSLWVITSLVWRNQDALRQANAFLEAQAVDLQEARDRAVESSIAKSQFLANMSHEIRTPMNGVIGMAEILVEVATTDEVKQYARIIRDSGDALLGVLNDILDVSKIEAGKVTIEKIEFDLGNLIEDVAELFARSAYEKGVELVSEVPSDLPQVVLGDPMRIRQIVTNLLSNAVKFTKDGEIHVTAKAIASVEGDSIFRISVRDTGIGVPKAALELIFESFQQADGSTTRHFGGTGLGLTICRQLCKLMGGEIGVKSQPGEGSEFWIDLPLTVTDTALPSLLNASDIRGMRVMIVDDNATNRFVLRRQLLDSGCITREAGSGPEALALLLEETVNPTELVVLDFQMPGMDGLELASRIKSHPKLSGLVIVMLSSVVEAIAPEVRASLGISTFLLKPTRRAQLNAALYKAAAVVRPPRSQYETELQLSKDDFSKRILVVDDNEVNRKVAKELLSLRGYIVDLAEDGEQALRMANELKYALIFMDIQMGGLDGCEATKRIRANDKGASQTAPVIALTAHVLDSDRERCIEAGMDDHLGKPVRSLELDGLLNKWLRHSEPLIDAA
ncbi:MAG: response regulator [Fimbriimonadaceae bacterium]